MRTPASNTVSPHRGSLRPLGASLAAVLVLGLTTTSQLTDASAAAAQRGDLAAVGGSTVDRSSVIVQLAGEPLATSPSVALGRDGTVDLAARGTRSARASLVGQRNELRRWLRDNAPQARITSIYDYAVHAVSVELNGVDAQTLRGAPGVLRVEFQSLYHPTAHEDPDLSLIEAAGGWSAAGVSVAQGEPTRWAGAGVRVGVIDSGIDAGHPCFDDTGYPAVDQIGDPGLTNDKVIVAEVFNNKAVNQGLGAAAIDSHGTHVAGTIACNLHTPAQVNGAVIDYDPSGVAPGALLGSYNVFPGEVANARSEDILNALQAAAEDGMQVINMSLGGSASGAQDLLTHAVDNLDRAGIVVAVSAGNEGPGAGTVSSPGSAERALTAGAATVGHYVGVPVSAAGGQVTVAATGEFPVPDSDLSAPLGVVADGAGLGTACTPLPADSLAGHTALVSRGGCTFGTKVDAVEWAGAVAVTIVNSVPGDPIAMAADPAFDTTIPAVMAPLSARTALMALDGEDVTIGAAQEYVRSGNDNILANFSSWGPTDVTYRVKPDVVAPGVNVLSSFPAQYCEDDAASCWAFQSGTSMAAPHLAGMAAVVRRAHPDWAAWTVRSAIVNTADRDAVTKTSDPTSPDTDVQHVGAGLADLEQSVSAQLALSTPSVAFGAIPSGSGALRSQTLTVTNLTDSELVLPVRIEGQDGAGVFAVSPSTLAVPAGGQAAVRVTFVAGKGAAKGPTQAILVLGDDEIAHAALFAYLK